MEMKQRLFPYHRLDESPSLMKLLGNLAFLAFRPRGVSAFQPPGRGGERGLLLEKGISALVCVAPCPKGYGF